MKLLVSACLLGVCCRYDGKSNAFSPLEKLEKEHCLIPVCPEQLGGLPTPRVPSERRGSGVTAADGRDVTAAFVRGAEQALALAQRCGCRCALLKERSPSCGSGQIYDGTFSHTLTAGDGVTAELLRRHGIRVFGESQLDELAAWLERQAEDGGRKKRGGNP